MNLTKILTLVMALSTLNLFAAGKGNGIAPRVTELEARSSALESRSSSLESRSSSLENQTANMQSQITELSIQKAAQELKNLELQSKITSLQQELAQTKVGYETRLAVIEEQLGINQEPTSCVYDVVLLSHGPRKINTIKIVRYYLGLGLDEALVLVNSAPGTLIQDQTEEYAENFKLSLEGAGSEVKLIEHCE